MKRAHMIAVGMAAVATLWLATGSFHAGGEAPDGSADRAEHKKAPVIAVQVVTSTAQVRDRMIKLTGRTGPIRTAEVRAQTPGRVIGQTLRKGSLVKAGDVIVRLDEQDRRLQVAAAKAEVARRQIAYDAAKKLSQKAYRSRVKLAEEQAALSKAKADLARAEAELDHMTLRAPFDGVLDERPVDPGDFLKEGDHGATVVDLDPIVVGVELSERHIGDVALGQTASVRLASGQTVQAEVDYRARDSRTQARTYRVELTAPNPSGDIPSGITADVTLALGQVHAHAVPASALTLDSDGAIGVKVVDDANVVRFIKADLVADTPEALWLGGLGERVRTIVVGQEIVKVGQTVKPVEATR